MARKGGQGQTGDMPQPSSLLTTAQVAVIVGRSVATVNRWAKTGRLRPVYVLPGPNGARLYDPQDVERFIDGDEGDEVGNLDQ